MILQYHSGALTAKLDASRKVLVSCVRFDLSQGESLALIGETGSGKTMIALSVMGLLPGNVSCVGSDIRFLGRPIPNDRSLLGTQIVYIPQNGLEFLNPSKKVRHHLYDSLRRLGIPRRQWETVATQKLVQAGFASPEAVLDKYPFQLSGGMAQRVTIAISTCSHAKLVIADEPTNGLDHQAREQFMNMLHSLFPEAAKLIITHDIGIAALCSKALVLCGGKTMELGDAGNLLHSPRHPYTKALMGALVENGMQETPVLRSGTHDCPFYRRCPQAAGGCTRCRHSEGGIEWWCSEG